MTTAAHTDRIPADARTVLAALQEAAPSSEDARARFQSALAAFKAAGWPWRQIGEAAGISHETARKLAAGADADRDLGFDVPVRKRPLNVIPFRDLPPGIAEDLAARLHAAIEEPSGARTESGLALEVAAFFAGLQSARDAGWDNYAIGPAIGVHPRAVSRFAARHPGTIAEATEYPPAPEARDDVLHRARRPAVPAVKIPAKDAAAIRDDTGNALGKWYLLGATREQLSAAAEADWETVRKRLKRKGFMVGGR
jgi:hypothetical protein